MNTATTKTQRAAEGDDIARMRQYLESARRAKQVRLPPEGRLAVELGVTRSRLRVVLKLLEQEGLIWRHVGKGTFIGERSLTTDISALADEIAPRDAMEARILVEPVIAGLAAIHASNREIEEMYQCLARMELMSDFPEWRAWDEKLHRMVARAARNILLLAIHDLIRESAPSGLHSRLGQIYSTPPPAFAASNIEHRGYVDAIRDRDPAKAEAMMRAHLLSIRQALFGDR